MKSSVYIILGFLSCVDRSLSALKDHKKSFKGFHNEDHALIYPTQTDHNGNHINLYQHYKFRPKETNFNLKLFNKIITLELKKHRNLFAKDVKFVIHNDQGSSSTNILPDNDHDCFYEGKVKSDESSYVTLTTCEGLYGVIKTEGQEYFIEPLSKNLQKRDINPSAPIPHIIYKSNRSVKEACGQMTKDKKVKSFDGLSFNRVKRERTSLLTTITIETAIFFDYFLYEYMAQKYPTNTDKQILVHILTFMGGVEILYNLPSLGQVPVHFVITYMEIAKKNQNYYNISDMGPNLMDSFCAYQEELNEVDDDNPDHWDHAVLMTGIDIRYEDGRPNLIGMAPIGELCSQNLSCSIVEGQNFDGLYILAHEFGHNFGMYHDGEDNSCDGEKYFMAPYTEPEQKEWSTCSKADIKEYLDNTITSCLQDARDVLPDYDFTGILPGQRYTKEEQCELYLGKDTITNPKQPLQEICQVLECLKGIFPVRTHSALEGTYCGDGMWCQNKKCVSWDSNNDLRAVDGGWGPWSEMSKCQSGCVKGSTGIQVSQRSCDKPRPQNGGRSCLGDKYRFELCSDYYLCKKTQRPSIDEVGREVCPYKPDFLKQNITGEGYQNLFDESGGCIIWCETLLEEKDEYISWNAFYPVGTSCNNGKLSKKDFCYQGKCIHFKSISNTSDYVAAAVSLYG